MSVTTAGVPIWVDLASSDVEGAKAFYGGLFGWTVTDSAEPDAGGYCTFKQDGQTVAGVGPIQMGGQPTAWTTYVSTDNAEETAAMVEKAGGQVLAPPMDVMGYGRMALFTDQSGAPFAVWQPGSVTGADVFNVPGSLTWTELTTRDPEGCKAFYGEVFGWTAEDAAMGPVNYTTWTLDGRGIAGMMPMAGSAWPAEVPAHWMVYFAVADTDATAAKATELGGTVSVGPTDLPVGRFAVFGDPQGGFFSVVTLNEPPDG
jgi:predicted enzyme related to lactoylglutathione lyase